MITETSILPLESLILEYSKDLKTIDRFEATNDPLFTIPIYRTFLVRDKRTFESFLFYVTKASADMTAPNHLLNPEELIYHLEIDMEISVKALLLMDEDHPNHLAITTSKMKAESALHHIKNFI